MDYSHWTLITTSVVCRGPKWNGINLGLTFSRINFNILSSSSAVQKVMRDANEKEMKESKATKWEERQE